MVEGEDLRERVKVSVSGSQKLFAHADYFSDLDYSFGRAALDR